MALAHDGVTLIRRDGVVVCRDINAIYALLLLLSLFGLCARLVLTADVLP